MLQKEERTQSFLGGFLSISLRNNNMHFLENTLKIRFFKKQNKNILLIFYLFRSLSIPVKHSRVVKACCIPILNIIFHLHLTFNSSIPILNIIFHLHLSFYSSILILIIIFHLHLILVYSS